MAHSLAGNSQAAESSALVGDAMGAQIAASVDAGKHHGNSDVSDSEDEGDPAEESEGSGSFCYCCIF